MSIISTNAYGDLQLNGYAWRWFVDSRQPSASFGFTFSTNKGHYTFIPDDFISKGLVVGGNQYYHKGFLNKSTLQSLYTQYQPIDFGGFRDFDRADDFYRMLKQNGFGTSGVLVPESWTIDNFHKAGSLGTSFYQIGMYIGSVQLGALQGMGEHNGQMVYVPTSNAVSGASQAAAWITGAGGNNINVQYMPKLNWYQKAAREISKVPLLPELAALGATLIPGGAAYAPYIYAGLKGAALGAQGVDPLKAALMVGINLAGQNILGNTALAKNIGASFGATTEAAQLAVGRVVLGAGVNGIKAGVTGGDVGKAMLSGAIAGGTMTAASFVSDALGKNADGFLKSITDNTNLTRVQAQEIIAASVVGGLVAETRGGDFGQAFVANLVNAGVTQSTANAMRDKLPETMTPEMRAAITRGVSTVAGTAAEALARGQNVDDYLKANLPNVLNSAMTAYAQEQAAIKEGWKDLNEKTVATQLFGKDATPQKFKEAEATITEILNNPNVDERALDEYIKSGILNKGFVEAITGRDLEGLRKDLSARVTTEAEANQIFKDIFGRDAKSESDKAMISQLIDKPEAMTRATFETVNIRQQDYNSVVFDASKFTDPNKAAEAAKEAGFDRFAMGGQEYVLTPPVKDAQARSSIESAKTFGEAFAAARKELGSGKVFEWKGQKYSTDIKEETALKNAYDGSSAKSLESAAMLAFLEKKDSFIAPDGKVYMLNDANKKAIEDYIFNQGKGANQDLAASIKAVDDKVLQSAAFEVGRPTTKMGQMFDEAFGATSRGLSEFLGALDGALDYLTTEVTPDGEVKKFFKDGSILKEAADFLDKDANRRLDPQFFEDYENAMARVNAADGIAAKTMAIVNEATKNPWSALMVIQSELASEVPSLLTGVVAARMASLGMGVLANGGLQAAEVGGNSYKEVSDAIKANGGSDIEAHLRGSSAFGASAAISLATAGVADAFLIKQLTKDIVSSNIKPFVSNVTAQYFAEGVQGGLEALWNHHEITGKWDANVFNTGFAVESVIGAATSAGILAPNALSGSAVVAATTDNRPITLDQLRTGNYQGSLDVGSLDTAAVVGKSSNGADISFGGLLTSPLIAGVEYGASQAFVPDVLTNQNIVVGYDSLGDRITLGDLMGKVTPSQSFDQVFQNTVNQDAKAREAEQSKVIEQALKDAGFTSYTANDIKSLVNINNPAGSQDIINKAQEYADPRVTTTEEAIQMLLAAGYTDPSPEEIQQFVGSIPESTAKTQVADYVAPRIVTEADARAFFEAKGYTPTKQEIDQFVRQGRDVVKTQVEEELGAYVDPRQVTAAEAEEMFKSLGFVPTKEEIDQFVQQGPSVQQDIVKQLLSEYVDPRMVTVDEVRAAFETLGFPDFTEEELQKLVGQYDQSLLADRATKELPTMTYRALTGRIQLAEQNILTKVQEYESAGMRRDEALERAINEVAGDLGTTRDELLNEIGEVERNVGQQITGLSQDLQTKYNALTDGQKALANQLTQQGIDLNTAIETASQQAAEALGETEQRLTGQIQTVADLLGKPARQVTQADIDYVNQMIQQGQQTDLAYDINQDGRIDQSDIDFMSRIMAGNIDAPWSPQAGTAWAPTGLYKVQAEEAEKIRTEQRDQAERARQLQLRGQMRQGLASVMQQAPQAIQQSYRKIDPIYAQTRYANLNAPLFQSNLWGEQPVAQNATNQPNQFRMASGGYLDTQGDPQTWDDIYRMLK
jgi:hypothetical protein